MCKDKKEFIRAAVKGISGLPVSKISLFEETTLPKPPASRVVYPKYIDIPQFNTALKNPPKPTVAVRKGFATFVKITNDYRKIISK